MHTNTEYKVSLLIFDGVKITYLQNRAAQYAETLSGDGGPTTVRVKIFATGMLDIGLHLNANRKLLNECIRAVKLSAIELFQQIYPKLQMHDTYNSIKGNVIN